MKISILIPTKNEPLINELVEEIHNTLNSHEHEIIVIDKSDITPNIVGATLVRQNSNGLGKAIIEGLEVSNGDVIVTMDGDFSHDPKDIPKLLDNITDYDIVIGSKFIEGGINEDNPSRKFTSILFQFLASSILGLNVKDPMSGFAAVKREVYNIAKPNPIGYKINMDLMYKAKKHNLKIREVPITFHKRKAGFTKVGFTRAGVREAYRVIRYMFELRLGLR